MHTLFNATDIRIDADPVMSYVNVGDSYRAQSDGLVEANDAIGSFTRKAINDRKALGPMRFFEFVFSSLSARVPWSGKIRDDVNSSNDMMQVVFLEGLEY